ncbi:MAG: endonuclease domain-containing protein [Flavobacteriales bacterium]|nr:endonuclease domain-containing protein [Flavobacteriales bacterium]
MDKMKITYNSKLKILARNLRNNSTKSEIILWSYLKGSKMMNCKFSRQKPIDNYIADFFCNELKLVIELDGYSHQIDEVFEKDVKKTKVLNNLGITVLRFDDKEVFENIDNVLREIEQFIINFEKLK